MQLLLFIHANSCDDMDEFTQWQFVLFRRRFNYAHVIHIHQAATFQHVLVQKVTEFVCFLKNCITSKISILVFSRKADPAAADQKEELFNMNTGMYAKPVIYFVFLTHIWHCTVQMCPSGCLKAAPACAVSSTTDLDLIRS